MTDTTIGQAASPAFDGMVVTASFLHVPSALSVLICFAHEKLEAEPEFKSQLTDSWPRTGL